MAYDTTDLAYAAGIIDGEGNVHIRAERFNQLKQPRYALCYSARVMVNMSDSNVLMWLHSTFGGHFSTLPKDQRKPHYRQMYRWAITGKNAATFLTAIRPWLKVKHGQADLVRKLYSVQVAGRIPEDELERRRRLKQQVHSLNQRGEAQDVRI